MYITRQVGAQRALPSFLHFFLLCSSAFYPASHSTSRVLVPTSCYHDWPSPGCSVPIWSEVTASREDEQWIFVFLSMRHLPDRSTSLLLIPITLKVLILMHGYVLFCFLNFLPIRGRSKAGEQNGIPYVFTWLSEERKNLREQACLCLHCSLPSPWSPIFMVRKISPSLRGWNRFKGFLANSLLITT